MAEMFERTGSVLMKVTVTHGTGLNSLVEEYPLNTLQMPGYYNIVIWFKHRYCAWNRSRSPSFKLIINYIDMLYEIGKGED